MDVKHLLHDFYHDNAIGGGVIINKKKKSPTRRRKSPTRKSPPNAWVQFLKKYANDKGISYAQALKSPKAKHAYRRQRKN